MVNSLLSDISVARCNQMFYENFKGPFKSAQFASFLSHLSYFLVAFPENLHAQGVW